MPAISVHHAAHVYVHSYHQKYLLRGHSILLNSLALTPSDLITSHVASRLNGYMGGHGSLEQFEEVISAAVYMQYAMAKENMHIVANSVFVLFQEKPSLGLSVDQTDYVTSNISRKSKFKCG